MATKKTTKGLRFDLLPPIGLRELARAATVGANKYGPFNYLEGGTEWWKMAASLIGHWVKWWFFRERRDPIDGQHHLASVAMLALILIDYEYRGLGVDTRPPPYEKGTYYEDLDEADRRLGSGDCSDCRG